MRSICIVTATRAEYGLMRPLMHALRRNSALFKLQILVTGAHLSPEFGYTYKQIEEDGFVIDEKVEMLLSADSGTSIVKSMGLGMIGFSDVLQRLNPDGIVILGDRYEMLSLATSASVLKIPILHLHGGEITEGAYDNAFRHAISKLSHVHFTSTEEHRHRVIQMGENPSCVFNVGAIGIDNIKKLPLIPKDRLSEELGVQWKNKIYQITYHPETLSNIPSQELFTQLLDAVDEIEDATLIFTKSNADTDGRIINKMIDDYVLNNENKAKAFTSLGALRFLSLLAISDGIIGNSSSGIIEAPSLKIPTINIGDRQKGRMQSTSVINTLPNKHSILGAIKYSQSKEFSSVLQEATNPYGDGNTTDKIIQVLETLDFTDLKIKSFYNIQF